MPTKKSITQHFAAFEEDLKKIKGFKKKKLKKVILKKKNTPVETAVKKFNRAIQAKGILPGYELHSFETDDGVQPTLFTYCYSPQRGKWGNFPECDQ